MDQQLNTAVPEGAAFEGAWLEDRYKKLLEKSHITSDVAATRLHGALMCAAEAHAGQKRRNGDPYIVHPIETANTVAEMGLDAEAMMAALLHDCIEDTTMTYEEIAKRFGAAVADIVEGVTKLTRVAYSTKEEEQMENLRKMFLAMARDIRVILIKIADRLHNMRTINYQTEQRQREIALETMEVYAPIAHRLGMQVIKWELEDRALLCLDPVGYSEIMSELSSRAAMQGGFLEQVQQRVSGRLEEAGIKAEIVGRVKHIYSIYRKMYSQHKAMFEIYDLYAVRVIVDTVNDCYNVLGAIHDLYKPIPGRFKDYISTPKPNMYQSLHSTVIGREGSPFEVQIRTWEMHRTAEFGIAAHWKYKDGVQDDTAPSGKLEWVRLLLESQQDTDAEEFLRAIKIDMFADEVFVFTPKGDVINLPAGAIPIDFAYAIHSAVGNRMTGVKINGRIATIDSKLENGDIVEVLTSGASKGPSRDWIKLARTSEARNKIKQWFKKEKREENIAHGRSEFEHELRRAGIPMATVTKEETLHLILKKLGYGGIEELYASIGYGGITATKAVNRIRDELVRLSRLQTDKTVLEKIVQEPERKPRRSATGVIVEGLDNCLVKFSRCCTPVPGDRIIGFITRGYGVSVHRTDCRHAQSGKRSGEEGRWVGVTWADEIKESYQTSLQISARSRDGLVVDLATIVSNLKVTLRSFNAHDLGDGFSVVDILLQVTDLGQLESVVNRISRVSGVIDVKRKAS